MYWKLVEITEFDALEQLYTSKAIVGVIQANNKAKAKAWFDKFTEVGLIKRSNAAEIEEATEDEYYNFTNQLLK